MQINLSQVSMRFGTHWVLKDLSYAFEKNKKYAITGINGSGKSTLMQIIASAIVPTKGQVNYEVNNSEVTSHNVPLLLNFVAPYIELIEEYNLHEIWDLYNKLKTNFDNNIENAIALGLEKHMQKPLKQLSTGMKQRVKLLLALQSAEPLLLLDEPFSNLDASAIEWFQNAILKTTQEKTVIISSNDSTEYAYLNPKIIELKL